MQLLQSPKLWSQIAKLRGNKPVIAAIAYANEDHLSLRAKDVLICDASDSRIATGAPEHLRQRSTCQSIRLRPRNALQAQFGAETKLGRTALVAPT